MLVPDDVIICRLIRPDRDYWSVREQRPKASVFKDNRGGLSVWDVALLEQHSASIADLLIDDLSGYGQSHHTAGDYRQFADDAAADAGYSLQVAVERRTGDEFVVESWREWSYAHIQVETSASSDTEREKAALSEFRRLLAFNVRFVIPPTIGN